jgi:hypothetical protein
MDLLLACVELVRDPSDGGLKVLREFVFSRSDTTLKRVAVLQECNFGPTQKKTFLTSCRLLYKPNRHELGDYVWRRVAKILQGAITFGSSLLGLLQKHAAAAKAALLEPINICVRKESVHFNQHCERIKL